MRLRDYLEVLRRRVILVVVIILVVGSVTVVLALRQKPNYQGAVRLLVRPAAPLSPLNNIIATSNAAQSQTDLATEAQLVASTQVAQAVIQKLQLQGFTPDALLTHVVVNQVGGAEVLAIDTTAATRQQAVDLANAFANSYLDVRRQQTKEDLDNALADRVAERAQLQTKADTAVAAFDALRPADPGYSAAKAQVDAIESQLGAVQQDITSLADQAALAVGFGRIIQPATTARLVRIRSVVRTSLFGGLVGFPLALAVVLLLESFKDTVQTKSEAEAETGVDVLGLIPFDPGWSRPQQTRLTSAIEPFSPVAEAYRGLANTLERVAASSDARIILVTSPGSGEGKTTTATNLGVALSDIGRDVVIVEANTRWPRAYEFLQADPTPGLAEVLSGQLDAPRAVQWLRASLGFIAAGTAAIRLDLALARADLTVLLRELRESDGDGTKTRRAARPAPEASPRGPVVLVDAAPVLVAGEVSALATAADGVLLVLRAGHTTRKGAGLAAEQVRRAGGRLLGVALVDVRSQEELGLSGGEAEYRPPRRSPAQVGGSAGEG